MKAQDRADAIEFEANEAMQAAQAAQEREDAAQAEIDSYQMEGTWQGWRCPPKPGIATP